MYCVHLTMYCVHLMMYCVHLMMYCVHLMMYCVHLTMYCRLDHNLGYEREQVCTLLEDRAIRDQ